MIAFSAVTVTLVVVVYLLRTRRYRKTEASPSNADATVGSPPKSSLHSQVYQQ
jgi:hypothetical protein